jgi:hypothetical protein
MVFFVWVGEDAHDAADGAGNKLQQFGEWSAMPAPYNGLIFGVFPRAGVDSRADIDAFHNGLYVLPGINGRLNAEQADIVKPAFADATTGSSMYDLLKAVYTATGAVMLDPDSY